MHDKNEEFILSNARIRLAKSLNASENRTAVAIQITEHALWYWQYYSKKYPDVETAAVLIGAQPILQRNQKYLVRIDDIIPGKYLIRKRGSVKLTADTWAYWNREMLERYPDSSSCILGYAHTHPHMPIFYSKDDVVVHNSSFTMPWHIGLVSDPHKPICTARFFGWLNNLKDIIDCKFLWPTWCDDFERAN